MAELQVEIVRDYTTTGRVPTLVGRFRDGLRLPGGPYTLVQVGIFVVLILLMNGLRPLWGSSVPPLLQWVLVFGVAAGGAWGARSLPRTTRNVISVVLGYVGALRAPATGKIGGRTVMPPRPGMAGPTPKGAPAMARAVLFAAHSGYGPVSRPLETAPRPLETAPPQLAADISAPAIVPAAFTGVDRLRALTRKEDS